MSVYVPDEQWESSQRLAEWLARTRPRAAAPPLEGGPSHFIQFLLRSWEGQVTKRPPYAELPEELREARDRARREATEKVGQAYQAGYATGLAMAAELPWEGLARFEQLRWHFGAWREWLEEAELPVVEPTPDEEGRVISFEESWARLAADTVGYAGLTEGDPVGIVLEGFVDAMRDVWEGASGKPAVPHGWPSPSDAWPAGDLAAIVRGERATGTAKEAGPTQAARRRSESSR